MNKKSIKKIRIIVTSITLFLLILTPFSPVAKTIDTAQISKNLVSTNSPEENIYKGYLRVYIVEIDSRWDMQNGDPYYNAFFDFAFNNEISIDYLDTYEDSIFWTGDIEQDNVIVMAAIFNQKTNIGYAYPPKSDSPFDAHYVDATAGAKPGETGSNIVNNDYTHTIFLEIGSDSNCGSCPGMANKVKDIYNSGNYPFYYATMVVNEKPEAWNRMRDDYNLSYLPTAFYEGGTDVLIGSDPSEEDHRAIIENSGKRDVHELDFSLSVYWTGDGEIQIDVSITNNEEIINNPPEKPTITGPQKAKAGNNLEFFISTNDPEEDDVYYCIDWGNGSDEVCIGPFQSGEQIQVNHIWEEKGTYIIKVKAKDIEDAESDYAELSISLPRSKEIHRNSIFFKILEIFSNFNNLTQNLF